MLALVMAGTRPAALSALERGNRDRRADLPHPWHRDHKPTQQAQGLRDFRLKRDRQERGLDPCGCITESPAVEAVQRLGDGDSVAVLAVPHPIPGGDRQGVERLGLQHSTHQAT